MSVQNNDLRGLADRHFTDSRGRFGNAGTVESCLAADVGKYIPISRFKSDLRQMDNLKKIRGRYQLVYRRDAQVVSRIIEYRRR